MSSYTKFELFRHFIQYSLHPTQLQLQESHGHPTIFACCLLYLIYDSIFQSFITIIFYNHILNINNIFTVIIFAIIIVFDILSAISDFGYIRRGIIIDMDSFLRFAITADIQNQYVDLFIWCNKFIAYLLYFGNHQYEKLECSICQEEYEQNNQANDLSLLRCGHKYHSKCLHQYEKHWYINIRPKSSLKCPYCRRPYSMSLTKYKFNPTYFHEFNLLHDVTKIQRLVEKINSVRWYIISYMQHHWTFIIPVIMLKFIF